MKIPFAIKADGVSKRYELGERVRLNPTLRDRLTDSLQWLRRGGGRSAPVELWAPSDVRVRDPAGRGGRDHRA
jgi:hypothetical protein